ncbi:TPA: hypothetical protein LU182_004170 [Enterobacter hormaechei subsp. xiangfangensis]|nr:hypothetical protein [Enterobacter hormaechei subsp. xiangfangensis]HBM2871003.1 hypothetical protein [Enterobacter hormaechei subsp. xiangfangensis]
MGFTEWDLSSEGAAPVSTTEVGNAGASRAVRSSAALAAPYGTGDINRGLAERFKDSMGLEEVFFRTCNGGFVAGDTVVIGSQGFFDSDE